MNITNIKSIWELMYTTIITCDNWKMIIDNLIPLFRKDTFNNIVKYKKYYPKITENCRFYIKHNKSSCGKGIYILNKLPQHPI